MERRPDDKKDRKGMYHRGESTALNLEESKKIRKQDKLVPTTDILTESVSAIHHTDVPRESTSATSTTTGLTLTNDCHAFDGDSSFKYYSDVESDHQKMLSADIMSKVEYTPKKYQTLLTNDNQEKATKKRARGRPTKYTLEWEDETKPKEYDPQVVQCCLCYRNLLFGCNGQKVFKKHKHFETNNTLCSSCQQVSDVNTLTTDTNRSQNTYEKVEHSSKISPGSIKPVSKIVYVVRPPSDLTSDKLIIKKPRVYKKRRPQTPALIDDLLESRIYKEVKECVRVVNNAHTNNMKDAVATTTPIWSQTKLFDTQNNAYVDDDHHVDDAHDDDDDDDDDDDQDKQPNYSDNDEMSRKYSSRKMFVKIGKPNNLGKSPRDMQTAASSRKRQKTLDNEDHGHALNDNCIGTEIKTEPVDPEYEYSQSNASVEKNCDIEVKVENVDPTDNYFSQTYEGTAIEDPLRRPYVNEDLTCSNRGNGQREGNSIPELENTEKYSHSGKYSHNTDADAGSAAERYHQCPDFHQNEDLAYVYLSNQDDASLPKSSLENERNSLGGDGCVAVIPMLNVQDIKKEKDTE